MIMRWTEVETAWNNLTNSILEQWPEMSAAKLAEVAGDREAFALYISRTYDLTVNEASEAIEDWLLRVARRMRGMSGAAA